MLKFCKKLNTVLHKSCFPLLLLLSHTHIFGLCGQTIMPLLPLLWEWGESNPDMHLIISDSTYNRACLWQKQLEEAVCLGKGGSVCVWYTGVPPMTTSVGTCLPVLLAGLMVSHHALYCTVTHTLVRLGNTHTNEKHLYAWGTVPRHSFFCNTKHIIQHSLSLDNRL